jgi:transcriptional regulator with XRE-family HTH domain
MVGSVTKIIQQKITGRQLRAKRQSAGIPGHVISRRAGVSRGWLSEVECEIRVPSQEELARIDAALDEIIRERAHLSELAASAGLSLQGVRL